ncbi:Probable envelope ADP,ATP carrier protein, chloroplastic [Linum perenne]
MREDRVVLSFRSLPELKTPHCSIATVDSVPLWKSARFSCGIDGGGKGNSGVFASLSMVEKAERVEFAPTSAQLLKHPLAMLACVPRGAAIFIAGAIAGAAAKTLTAPLDRVKILMQTHGIRVGQESAKKAIGFVEALALIGKEEGIKGYWKGNLPQVIRIIPYSAVQLFSYEFYKVTYPLDVLRLRLAVDTGHRTMIQIALTMMREEGAASFYYGLGPSLVSIAPYIAVNFCMFDLVKKSLPEKYKQSAQSSVITAVVSAAVATITCYPLDTVRRQMQMRGAPYKSFFHAFPGIVERDGFIGLYRGFLPNVLKNLPNSSIRLSTFDIVKRMIAAGEKELQQMVDGNRAQHS